MFDSVVQGGDAVWEGLRIYDGKVFKLDEHLDRCSSLVQSSVCIPFSVYGLSNSYVLFFSYLDCLILQKLWPSEMCLLVIG